MNLTNDLQLYYKYCIQSRKIDYIYDIDPTVSVNPPINNAIWWNTKSGELFICIDNTPDKNIWKGTKGTIVCPSTLSKFDIFGDGSSLLALTLDNTYVDLGGKQPETVSGTITFDVGRYGSCIKSSRLSQLVYNIPELSTLNVVTVSAWINWNGTCCVMPFGFARYDIYFCCARIGFNTGNGDIYGNVVTFPAGKWVHIVAKFVKGDYRNGGQIWINGEPIPMTFQMSLPNINAAQFGQRFYVFGWGANSSHRNFGMIDHIRVFNRDLTADEILYLSREV